MIDYFKLLSDPSHAWLHDLDSPFRTPNALKKFPCIYFKFRTHKLKVDGGRRQRLKIPVADNPCLRIYKEDGWTRRSVGYPISLSVKERFNYQIPLLIKCWHREAKSMNCDHEKPYLVMEDDTLAELFQRKGL